MSARRSHRGAVGARGGLDSPAGAGLALLGVVVLLLARRRRRRGADPERRRRASRRSRPAPLMPLMPRTPRVRRPGPLALAAAAPGRAAVIALGAAALGYGAWLVLTDLPIDLIAWLAVWLAGAIVVHDGLIAPIAQLAGVAIDRTGRGLRMPRSARLLVAGGLAVGGAWTLVAAPEIVAKARGAANPTVLAGDYAAALAWAWIAIAVAVVVGAVVLTSRARSRAAPRS